jgi:hypothetical protein
MNGPAMDGSVIDGDAALGYHLFQVPEAKIVSQVPADAEQDHGSIKMPAFEHGTLRRRTEAALAATLKQNVCNGSQLQASATRKPCLARRR